MNGYVTGSFANVQTMFSLQSYEDLNSKNVLELWQNGIFRDANGNLMIDPTTGKATSSANTEVLDSSGPNYGSVFYQGRADASVGPGASPFIFNNLVGTTIYGNDNPRSDIPNLGGIPQTYSRVDNFFIYVMYNPNPHPETSVQPGVPNSIWIPVGIISWTWGMKLEYKNNVWIPIGNGVQSSQPYQENKLFPTWNRNIEGIKRNWGIVTP